MRTIRVTGKGQIKVRPDTTRITITLEGIYACYNTPKEERNTYEMSITFVAFSLCYNSYNDIIIMDK